MDATLDITPKRKNPHKDPQDERGKSRQEERSTESKIKVQKKKYEGGLMAGKKRVLKRAITKKRGVGSGFYTASAGGDGGSQNFGRKNKMLGKKKKVVGFL